MKHQSIKNVMPTTLCMQVWNELRGGKWFWGHVSKSGSIPHWSRYFGTEDLERIEIDETSGKVLEEKPIMSGELEIDNEVIQKVWNYIKPKYFEEDDILSRCYANGATQGIDNKVHQDSPNNGSKTIIIYINPEWHIDHGGETIIYNQEKAEIVHSEPVRFNHALLIPGYCWHGARSVTQYCKEMRITLMFKTEKPEFIKD
jgi:SM-20-related protein